MDQDNQTREQLLAEKQKLEEMLRLREHEISALLTVKPQPVIARFDRTLRHTYVHATIELASAIPAEAYLGHTSREMGMPEPAITRWENALDLVFEKGVEKTIEYGVSALGRKWVYESLLVPEFNQRHQVESVLTITRDISRQKRAEVALLENYQILETVHRVGQVLAAELDLQKLVQVVTDAGTELSRAEIGAFFYNVLDKRGESYTLYAISGVPQNTFSQFPMPRNTDIFGPTFRGEGTVRMDDVRKDPRYGHNAPYNGMPKGHFAVSSYLAVPVISQSQAVIGGLFFGHSEAGVFTERDERVIEGLAAQAAIAMDNARLFHEAQDQRERLRITLASIGDAVISTDVEGCIKFMNAIAQTLTGWTEVDALGKPLEAVFRIVNEETRETVENPVTKVLRDGKVVGLANHTVLLSHDGREIPIDDSGAPIFDESHTIVGVILVFHDITERRQSEKRINLLLQLSAAFSQALTAHQVAEVVVEQALKALGANLGTVMVLAEQGTMLEILNLHGLSEESIQNYRRTPVDFSGPVSDAVRMDRIIWIETLEDYMTRYPHFADNIKRNGTRSTVCIPLKINEKIIGGFNLSFPIEKLRNPDEEAFFTALAQLCAQALERVRLYEVEQKVRAVDKNG
ncbi:MAG: GAF domain-containing protein [Anaerolineae bacterium]|nr:GAF domain-containing protein [Anaerolineae bacterium]